MPVLARPGRGAGGGGPRQDAPIEHSVQCSLEELYRGVTKRLKISRNVADASGRAERMAETLSVEVKPGWKRGTKVTFPKKGAGPLSVAALSARHACGRQKARQRALLQDRFRGSSPLAAAGTCRHLSKGSSAERLQLPA